MHLLVRVGHRRPVRRGRPRDGAQARDGLAQRGRHRAPGAHQGEPRRLDLQRGAQLEQPGELLGVERGDARAAVRLDAHEALGLQRAQGGPGGDAGHTVALDELALDQPRAGGDRAGEDRVPQLGGQAGDRRGRGRAFGPRHAGDDDGCGPAGARRNPAAATAAGGGPQDGGAGDHAAPAGDERRARAGQRGAGPHRRVQDADRPAARGGGRAALHLHGHDGQVRPVEGQRRGGGEREDRGTGRRGGEGEGDRPGREGQDHRPARARGRRRRGRRRGRAGCRAPRRAA
jgi:hypothetical protein